MGVSQTDLGNSIGVTFQQIQKYERGTNRASASRLYQIAVALGVEVAYFFEDLSSKKGGKAHDKKADVPDLDTILSTAEGIELCTYFPKMKNRTQRRQIAKLVRSIVEADARNGDG